MSTWQSGDSLSPSILNLRAASASTSGGYSTNTLLAESGTTISASTFALSVGTISATNVQATSGNTLQLGSNLSVGNIVTKSLSVITSANNGITVINQGAPSQTQDTVKVSNLGNSGFMTFALSAFSAAEDLSYVVRDSNNASNRAMLGIDSGSTMYIVGEGKTISIRGSQYPGVEMLRLSSVSALPTTRPFIKFLNADVNINQQRLLSNRTIDSLASSGNGLDTELWFTIGLSVTTMNLRSGNTTYYWAASATTNV